jgi:uncharacterized protein
MVASSGPIGRAQRITTLDSIRGVATLAILPMNALAFGLAPAAYRNVAADGSFQPLDWIIGVATLILVDQKAMGAFSLLFGVGVVIFADRAKAKGKRVIALSLWRFGLLLVIGLLHAALWDGDILVAYAICAPIVLLVRNLPAPVLGAIGVASTLAGSVAAPFVEAAVGNGVAELGDYWFVTEQAPSDPVSVWFIADAFGRALGMMLIGVALFRFDVIQGGRSDAFYRTMARWGLAVGGLLTTVGLGVRIATDWSSDYAVVGHAPTGFGTIPMVLGFTALLVLWDRQHPDQPSPRLERFRNVGRMALTNYLTQTILGVTMLTWLAGDITLSRTAIAVWILAVWALQLWWSTWWMERFRFGPFEWAWRAATYRTLPAIRRTPVAAGSP